MSDTRSYDALYKSIAKSAFGFSMGTIWQHMTVGLRTACPTMVERGRSEVQMKVEALYTAVLKSAFGFSTKLIWQHMDSHLGADQITDEERVDLFFEIMRRLMAQEKIKLVRDEIFLSGSIDEQLDELRKGWPVHPEEDDLDGFGMWFLTACSIWVVWIDSDGTECWT